MGYRIDYQAREGVLSAVVSGKSKYAARIARDIAAHVGERELLIDLRRLEDRVGNLGPLLNSIGRRRIAVLDVVENDRHYVFAEMFARSLGCTLRCFTDATSAIRWLQK
jgi:hypothetical protein